MTQSGPRSATVALLITAAVGSVYAQVPGGQSGSTAATPQRPAQTEQSAADSKSFINDLAIAGMAEVQLGKLATERAASADVKAFGQMMVMDHSKAGDELKQVASQLNVQPPTQLDPKHRDLAERLSKLQGAAFDRAYMDAMVQGHQEVLAKLRARSTNPHAAGTAAGGQGELAPARQGEQALTQWATKASPTVQQHLERAQELQKKVAR